MSIEDKSKFHQEMIARKSEIEAYLKKLDNIIYENETKYLENTVTTGNVLKGWEQIFTSKSKIPHGVSGGKRFRILNNERIFSQTSVNNQLMKEDNLSVSHSFHNGVSAHTPKSISSPHRHKKKITQSLSFKKKKTTSAQKEVELDPDY